MDDHKVLFPNLKNGWIVHYNGKSTSLLSLKTQIDKIEILSHRFAIYVPSLNHDGLIPKKEREYVLTHCRSRIIQLCGGSSELRVDGSFPTRRELVFEQIRIIVAWFSENKEDIIVELFDLARWLKETLRQECVAVEFDFHFYLI